MSESKSESRVIDCFGPNFLIETNGPVGVAGPVTYQMYAVTDKGAKWQQALHGSGLATMEADHTLEIQTGFKNKEGQNIIQQQQQIQKTKKGKKKQKHTPSPFSKT